MSEPTFVIVQQRFSRQERPRWNVNGFALAAVAVDDNDDRGGRSHIGNDAGAADVLAGHTDRVQQEGDLAGARRRRLPGRSGHALRAPMLPTYVPVLIPPERRVDGCRKVHPAERHAATQNVTLSAQRIVPWTPNPQ